MIAALTSPLAWPFVVLALSVLFIIVAISKLKLHPFLALMMAGLCAGLLSAIVPDSTLLPDGTRAVNSVLDVTKLLMTGFGTTAGNVAMSIGGSVGLVGIFVLIIWLQQFWKYQPIR